MSPSRTIGVTFEYVLANFVRVSPALILALALGGLAFESAMRAIDLPVGHLDGAFQTASSLDRLGSGELPGRDFYPYLGIGPLLFIFPAYELAGANLAASVFAAHFTTLTLGALGFSAIAQFTIRPQKLINAFAIGFASFWLLFLFREALQTPGQIQWAFDPGNSLRPVRAAAPYVVALGYFLIIRSNLPRFPTALGLGGLTAVAFLWSNDFAIPTVASFSMMAIYLLRSRNVRYWCRSVVFFLMSMSLTGMLLLIVSTGAHPLQMIRFNFIDVARDQWWYFPNYSENARIFDLTDLSRLATPNLAVPTLTVGLAILVAIRSRRIEHQLLVAIGFTAALGGVIPSVGGYLGAYFGGFEFWGIGTIGFAAIASVHRLYRHEWSRASGKVRAVTAFVSIAGLLLTTLNQYTSYENSTRLAKGDASRIYVSELGGYLGREWNGYIELARDNKEAVVVEEYWGLWSAISERQSVWPVDSIIHALGDSRQRAADSIEKADRIITTSAAYRGDWQSWSLTQNFWFYERLFKDWEPVYQTPTTIVWSRASESRRISPFVCDFSEGKMSLSLGNKPRGNYAVKIDYVTSETERSLIMLTNNLSGGADADGRASIPNRSGSWTVPIFKESAIQDEFFVTLLGDSGSSIRVRECSAYAIPFTDPRVLSSPSESDFYVSDEFWEQGVSRLEPLFYVPNEPDYRSAYRPGRMVVFPDGESRTIEYVSPEGAYLHVIVEGGPLDPSEVGFPSGFVVEDR